MKIITPNLRVPTLLAIFMACFLAAIAAPAAAEQRVTFHNSITAIPPVVAATKHALLATAAADTMEFGVALKLRNYEKMQARVARGETISRAELEFNHLPLQADYDAVVKWLTGQGFKITLHDPSRLVVYASGTTAQVQASLGVHLVTVTANGGTTYHAADTAPSLPLAIATPVLGINHLQPYHQRIKRAMRLPQTSNAPPFKISEILTAYNGTNLGVTGANQKIAILIDTVAKTTDLTSFWSANNIGQSLSNIETVNVTGGTLPKPSGEETLDEEWSSGVAPGAKLRVYASSDLSDANLDKCLQRLINDLPSQPQIHQLSISLGLGETYVSQSQFTTDAQLFATIASGGVSIFVSSGDGGSTPDSSGGSTGPLQVEHYASDPSVTAVGGTSVYVSTSTGARTSESAWSGSGGGVSIQFAKPSWQTGTGVPSGNFRCVPDVALAADPNTGCYVVLSGAVQQYGGTSWSAPTWAGFCALVNEARANAGKASLGLINPSLYPLLGTNNFVDITTGSNATSKSGGKYTATTGYDQATGLGVPHMANLLATLVGLQAPAPTVTSFTPTSGVQNTSVTITGTNFGSASAVKFNGTTASYTVNSTTQITALSPAGATTGPISVTTPNGTGASSTNFTVVAGAPVPTISGFSPAYGLAGSSVVITGTSFTGATSVTIGGVSVTSYSVDSVTQITATVPAAAATGTISVTTSSGTATSSGTYTVLTGDGKPTINSFSPTSGAIGSTVTIAGTNFVNVTSVTFGGTAAVSPTVSSATQIVATVPSGATTGAIVVTTGLGSASSSTNFTVTASPTSSVSISQIYGGGGNTSATYLNDFVELYNHGVAAVDLTNWSVQYANSTGSTWSTVALSGTIQPGHYYLAKLASGGSVGTALPTADATNTGVNLSATNGKVALLNVTTALTVSSPIGMSSLADFVGYGSANAYEGTGPAPSPSATTADFRLNGGATDSGDNAADFTTTTPNPRNSSTGTAAPDLTVTKTHSGSFIQGDTGKTYTITVTNSGTASTSGTVTVTDTLPSGLTATAFSGTGWNTTLNTLTATRSDALNGSSSYPPLTLTVSVAANATNVTNVATVSGGSETNTTNDTANDATTITSGGVVGSPTVLAAWDMSGQSSYGTSPLSATTADANVAVGGLTRGSGVTTLNTGAARGWGGTGFNSATEAAAITAGQYVSFTITARAGFMTSLSSLSKFDYRRSSTGPPTGVLQYQVGTGAFTDLATVSYASTSSSGASLAAIDLSGQTALQNVAAGTVITFRLVNYGASANTGPWYIYDVSSTTAADFALSGTVSAPPAPDLTIAKSHTGNFTQGDTGKTYTISVSNAGNAATNGTVSVTDTLPTGLTATSFGGQGWSVDLDNLKATRGDALAIGGTYPPLTLTVSVARDASTSLTNIAAVSGGGETNTANDSASDLTTVNALTPSQSWRLQWFGSSANSGAGADLAIAGNDGLTNLLKYALNLTPPQSPASTGGKVVLDSSTGVLRLTITKNSAATDVNFQVQSTGNILDPNSWSTSGIVIDQNTSTTLQAHDTTPLTNGPRFIRLNVTRP